MSDIVKLRLFATEVPIQVIQNLMTAIDPQLLTEHTIMLLFHDLSKLLPAEELPRRLADLLVTAVEDDEDEYPTH